MSRRIALVTGAARGIGRAIALELAGQGRDVAVANVLGADAEQVAAEVEPCGARGVLPGMVERGWGRIVNISSDAGRVGSSGESVYAGAKAAVIAFTKTIARESARAGVTANVVAPGPTQTRCSRRCRRVRAARDTSRR